MNPPHESRLSSKVEINETSNRGNGLFASELITEGEPVVIFGGEYTDEQGAEEARGQDKLVMQWDEDLFSIEERGDDPSYYINHSCDSNLWMQGAFTLTARHDIQPGEEVTADYALWEMGDFIASWQCLCGSSLCRHQVTGKDWQIHEIQKRYLNHFSPLINKLIEKSDLG